MARIVFAPLANPDGLESFESSDVDDPLVLQAGQFTALYPGHFW
jgi:hypothetical protein